MDKKHTRNFSLDVHPYMLTIRKPKVETAAAVPLPSEESIDEVFLEGTHTIVHVSAGVTGIFLLIIVIDMYPALL